MENILVVYLIVALLGSAFSNSANYIRTSEPLHENNQDLLNYPKVSVPSEPPSFLYPVYLRITDDVIPSADIERDLRDNLRITLGTIKRKKRSRPFTRFNSTIEILAEAIPNNTNTTSNATKPIPVIYSANISLQPLVSEPLIMIRSPTKPTKKPPPVTLAKMAKVNKTSNSTSKVKINKPKQKQANSNKTTTTQIPLVDRGKSSLTNTTLPSISKSNSTSTIKIVINSKPTKPAKRPHPDPPPPPPIGDVTEEEYDEEEDDFPQSDSEDSSEEEKVDKPKKSEPPKKSSSQTTTAVPTKGDTGSTEIHSDKSVETKKKSKKKKKGHKKVKLHFIPAPLGPKADLMIRLDKVHHNVREIFSVVKGVFSDYVVQRPHVNIEVALKGEQHPHEKAYADRSDWFDSYEPVLPKQRRRKHPSKSISKRILEIDDCSDDESCESSTETRPPIRPNKRPPYSIQRIPMPYPIYMESTDDDSREYSPFDYLPPLRPTYFNSGSGEKTWVRTWDKKKNGLPKLADSSEASKHVRHRTKYRQESDEYFY